MQLPCTMHDRCGLNRQIGWACDMQHPPADTLALERRMAGRSELLCTTFAYQVKVRAHLFLWVDTTAVTTQ